MKKRVLTLVMVVMLCIGLLSAGSFSTLAMSWMDFLWIENVQPGDALQVDDDFMRGPFSITCKNRNNRDYAVVGVSDIVFTSPVERIDVIIYGDHWKVGSLGAVITIENGATYRGVIKEYADGVHINFTFDNALSQRYELYVSLETSGSSPSFITSFTNHLEGGIIGGSAYGFEFGVDYLDQVDIANSPSDSVLSLMAIDVWGRRLFRGEPAIPRNEGEMATNQPKYSLLTEPLLVKRTYDILVSPYRSAMHLDGEGNLHYLYDNGDNVKVKVFGQNLTEMRSFEISKLLPIFGTFTMDLSGNYYIAYGKGIIDEKNKNEKNIVIAKYDEAGKLIGSTYFVGGEGYHSGTKNPFDLPPSMAISKTHPILALHFSRTMFRSDDGLNHQSSTSLYVDINTMLRLDMPISYTSHSFDQAVIATSDGGFLFADRGDAYPRGFAISKSNVGGYMRDILGSLPGITPFHFRELSPYQSTNSRLGGIAESSYGYLLAGVSDRVLSNIAIQASSGGPQDLFIQMIDKEFYFRSDADAILSDGMTRKSEGIQNELGLNLTGGQSYFLPANTIDYGVVWLTSYRDGQNAVNPRVVATEDNFVLMWERWGPDNRGWYSYLDTWYMVLNADGSVEKPATQISGNPRLNAVSGVTGGISCQGGKILWITNERNIITIYSLELYDKPSSWAIDQVNAAITAELVPQSLQSRFTQPITRAEFCALAVTLYESMKGEITERITFPDTNDVNVEKMAAANVVEGIGENQFAPDAALTREQAATLLARLADAMGNPLPSLPSLAVDKDSFSWWAAESIGQVQAAGVMNSTSTSEIIFSPQSPYTREQSIVTILRMFDYLNQF